MERRKFTREFKLEAVRLIRERGVTVAQAGRDLGVHQTVLRNWVKAFADDPQHSTGRAGIPWFRYRPLSDDVKSHLRGQPLHRGEAFCDGLVSGSPQTSEASGGEGVVRSVRQQICGKLSFEDA